MPTKYYRKDIPEMPVYIFGKPLKFEILETSDASLIEELDKCIQFGRGGVIGISAQEFEQEAQKKTSGISSESVYKQKRQRQELSSPLLAQEAAAGAGDIRISSAFAQPQEREHTPHNRPGLPGGAIGPAPGKPMPDPIDLPKVADMKPPTAKLSEVAAVK
jgi:hypothetical protein